MEGAVVLSQSLSIPPNTASTSYQGHQDDQNHRFLNSEIRNVKNTRSEIVISKTHIEVNPRNLDATNKKPDMSRVKIVSGK